MSLLSWKTVFGLALPVLALVCAYLSAQLAIERSRHELTTMERDVAQENARSWQAVARAHEPKITALQESIEQCLDRERQSFVDATERKTILDQIQTRPGTGQKGEIVDEASRKSVVQRLNRPLEY